MEIDTGAGGSVKVDYWEGARGNNRTGRKGLRGQDSLEKKKVEETTLIGELRGRRVGPRRRLGQLVLCGPEALGTDIFCVTSSCGPSSFHTQLCDILPHVQAAMHLRRGIVSK